MGYSIISTVQVHEYNSRDYTEKHFRLSRLSNKPQKKCHIMLQVCKVPHFRPSTYRTRVKMRHFTHSRPIVLEVQNNFYSDCTDKLF